MGHYLISYGGVSEVTGSMHMIVFNEGLENETKILLDAGGFQGLDSYAKNAYLPGSINPAEIKYQEILKSLKPEQKEIFTGLSKHEWFKKTSA